MITRQLVKPERRVQKTFDIFGIQFPLILA